jgi:hypothetical protein
MNAPARGLRPVAATRKVSPLDALIARAEARAILWREGKIDLHTAVDELWASASDLIAELGADKVQQLLTNAFAPVRDDLVSDRNDVDSDQKRGDDFDDDYEGLTSTFAKACREADQRARARQAQQRARPKEPHAAESTLKAAEYLVQQRDPKRLRAWLAKHTPEECEAILRHLEQKARQK